MSELSTIDVLKGTISEIPEVSGFLDEVPVLSGELSEVINYRPYEGDYRVVPQPNHDQTLPTENKLMKTDLVVAKIPFYKFNNETYGQTVYIGSEV